LKYLLYWKFYENATDEQKVVLFMSPG